MKRFFYNIFIHIEVEEKSSQINVMVSDEQSTLNKEEMHAESSQLPMEMQYTDADEMECMILFY